MFSLLLAIVLGQCAGGSCPMPPSFSARYFMPASASYFQQAAPVETRLYAWHWVTYDGLPVQVWGFKLADGRIEWEPDLRENAEQITKSRKPRLGGLKSSAKVKKPEPAVAAPAVQPVAVPAAEPAAEKPITGLNFGLNDKKLAEGTVGYTSNSPAAATELMDSHAAGVATNDRYYFTVIGDKADRAAVKASYDGAEWAADKDQVWFGEYDKGEWQVTDSLGYHADNGKPTVLLQDPSGRVLYRAFDFTAGSEPIIKALRKANPDYHHENDPGPIKKGKDEALLTPGRIALALAAGLLILLVMPRKQS